MLLKYGLETITREQGTHCIIVEARNLHQMLVKPYDAVFCMRGLKPRLAASFPQSCIFEVTNIFDLDELRTLLDQAVGRCCHSRPSFA